MRSHAINWFEIPVIDFERARSFYERIFDYKMPEAQIGPARMGFFIYDNQQGGRGGAIVHNPGFYEPAASGSLVYLNCEPDLQLVLDKVEAAGGNVLLPKKEVAAGQRLGFWALMLDTEGNRVALHSMQ